MQTDYRSLGCLINPPKAETEVVLEIRNKDRTLDGETLLHKRFCLAERPTETTGSPETSVAMK